MDDNRIRFGRTNATPVRRHGHAFSRAAASSIATALADTPVVMVNGRRQCGKTTLVRSMAEAGRAYITLDDDTTHAAAQADRRVIVRT